MVEAELEVTKDPKATVVSLLRVLLEHFGDHLAEEERHIRADGEDGGSWLGEVEVGDVDDILLEGGTCLRKSERFV